jgi:hypothetical protein
MLSMIAREVAKIARGLIPGVCLTLAVLGMLAPSAARFAGPDGPAWFPGHGHIFLSHEAARHDHAHPWDHPAPDAARAATADDVIFTLGDLDLASALAMIALPALALLLAIVWRSDVIGPGVTPVRGMRWGPLPPPPQR